jgi:hypothetical protein
MGKTRHSFMDRTQQHWLRALDTRLRSAHAHEIAAELSARLHDHARAAAEYERARAERRAYAAGLAEHPEWTHPTGGSVSARDTKPLDATAPA